MFQEDERNVQAIDRMTRELDGISDTVIWQMLPLSLQNKIKELKTSIKYYNKKF